MTARSEHNGRSIVYVDNRWIYEDSTEPVLRSLDWLPGDDGTLTAQSRVFHDEGSGLDYAVHHDHGGTWVAMFEGAEIAAGDLGFCLAECAKSENATLEPEVDSPVEAG